MNMRLLTGVELRRSKKHCRHKPGQKGTDEDASPKERKIVDATIPRLLSHFWTFAFTVVAPCFCLPEIEVIVQLTGRLKRLAKRHPTRFLTLSRGEILSHPRPVQAG